MSFRVRPATGEDFRAIYQMAKLTGGGFTNLPADRATLVAKLARSDRSFERDEDSQAADLHVFVLEDPERTSSAAPARCSARLASSSPFIPTMSAR